MSVLEKMILRNGPQSPIPLVTAIDMIFAGIDTTGNTLASLLYHLANNPEKQEKLRLEYAEKKQLSDTFPYFQACLQESLRYYSSTKNYFL